MGENIITEEKIQNSSINSFIMIATFLTPVDVIF